MTSKRDPAALTRKETGRALAATLATLARDHRAIFVATIFLQDGGCFTIVTPSLGDTDEECAENERAVLQLTHATITKALAGRYESTERGIASDS